MAFDDEIESSYELDEGGFVQRFTGTVRSARFGFNSSYNDGETCLLEFLVEPSEDDADEFGEGALDEDGLYTVLYSVGDKFEDAEGGATVVHESGRARRFNKRSGIGELLNAAAELDGLLGTLKGRGPATQADIWVGLTFTFDNVAFSFTNKDDEEVTYTRLLPVEFVGEDGAETKKAPAKKAPAKKAPAKKPAAKKAEPEPEDDGDASPLDALSAKVRGQLKKLAQDADDHDAFMETAYATLDVDDALEAVITDEDAYTELAG